MDEAQQIVDVLTVVSQPFIGQEVMLAVRDQGKIVYDGDLTGRPVPNRSTTYPNVAYGHMSDAVQLGYQAAIASFHSPMYGRQWLSVVPHPGDTVACTEAEAMFLHEHFAAFAANFVFCGHWVRSQCAAQRTEGWQEETLPGVRAQVRVMAHTSAHVEWHTQAC